MEISALLQQTFGLALWNFAELCVFGGILMLMQWWIPAQKQNKWDSSSTLDVVYSFVLTLLTPFFYAMAISVFDIIIQLIPSIQNISSEADTYFNFPVQLLLALFVIDFISYWRHRIMHMKWLWPIHAIHHCSKRLNWLSNERFHLFNFFISTLVNTLAVQILLGAEVALLSALIRRFYNFFIHANIKVDYGVLGYIFVSPRFHHWHHSSNNIAIDKNYCTFFSCIDWVFGTFYLPKNKEFPTDIGINEQVDENFRQQFIYPFSTWKRMRANK